MGFLVLHKWYDIREDAEIMDCIGVERETVEAARAEAARDRKDPGFGDRRIYIVEVLEEAIAEEVKFVRKGLG